MGVLIELPNRFKVGRTHARRLLGELGFSAHSPGRGVTESDEKSVEKWTRKSWFSFKK
jgi:hypothetical protein